MDKLSWTIRDVHGGTVSALSAALGVRQVTARCLAGRGIVDPGLARSYLEPRLAELRPPAGLAGLSRAVDRLCRAVCAGERIGCFGDYDVDGVTTTALVAGFLRQLGASALARVARRDAGYGFGEADARWFADNGVSVVVTGDCGTSDVAAIRLAAGLGVDVIVIDHHTVPDQAPGADGEVAPHPAFALINPLRNDSTFPFRGMASVGLAFYVMQRMRTRLRELGYFASAGRGARPEPDLREWLDVVAIGTIADLVPLSGENRILTHAGLRRLSERRRPGLAALLARAGVGLDQVVDERVVGWKLAPRLNAPGRLGDAEPALALLLAQDRGEAEAAAEALERANVERRAEQDRVTAEALASLGESGTDGPALIVAGCGWPSGVVGIVAARLVDAYRRPAFVIAIDAATGIGRGSARSAGGVNLYRALERAAPHLVRYGGHAAAAGLTVAADRIPALRESLFAAVAEQAEAGGAGEHSADAEVELGEVDERLADELASLAPFGKGNEQPVLVGRGLRVRDSRRVGDGSHLKLVLEGAGGAVRAGIAFGLGDRDPGPGSAIDCAFSAGISTWGGGRSVELHIRELARAPQ
ncbi:MAG TPA: single-stranded-DNA-specific exonuclease RecJ [Kofleriaceae bacterium]|nr:single-stranded-DNA-specific exonuclease RecJ [Kofleriaceae bacterium]